MTTEELKKAGRALYGDRWQTALARRLRVDPSTVRRWLLRGKVPSAAAEAVRLLVRESKNG